MNEQQLFLIDTEGLRLRKLVFCFDEASWVTLFVKTMIECGLLCCVG